jgi:zinc protease
MPVASPLYRAALLVAACLLAPLVALAQPALPEGVVRGPSVEGITEYRLANGLRVLLFPDASKPTTTVNMTYLVGSRHESYGETGMAHLLEHLVFKATPSIPSVFQELGRRGMRFNGTTSFDRTNYFETFSADEANLEWALRMEAERMTQSAFAKADLDTEMSVVRNEFESGENSAQRVLWKRLQALAYDWHNYGNVTIGARSDVENVDIDRLRAFYRTYYQPDNAVLTIAGRFDPAKALALVARYFGPIPKPPRALPRLYTREPVQDGERTVTVRRVGSEKLVALLYRIPAAAHPDVVPLEVLGEVLTIEPAGRMYRALVETKKATSVWSWSLALADPGVLMFWAQLPLEEAVEPLRDAMIAQVEGVPAQPVTDAEVERIRTRYLTHHEKLMNDPQALGVALSEAIALGDWRLLFVGRDRLRKVTAADVNRVAAAYLKPANRTVGTFVPEAEPDRAPEADAVDVAALVANYKGDEAVAAGETFEPTPANLDARTQRFTLPGGMKVALLPKKTRGATVRFTLRLRQGTEQSLMDVTPTGTLMGALLTRGTTKRDRQAFDDELDRLRARVSIGGSETAVSAGGETVREHAAAVLRLVVEAMRTPALPASELDKLKRETVTALEAGRTEPEQVVGRALSRHDNPYPKGHVRYSPTIEEEIGRISAVTIDDVRRFHERFVGASHGEIAIVGDFDAEPMRKLIEELFADWKSPSPYARVQDPFRPPTPVELRFETPDKANAVIAGNLVIALRDLDTDYPPLMIAERILGGSTESRLSLRLREKEGLSYGVGTSLAPGQIDDRGRIDVYAIFPPKELARVRAALDEEIAKALKDGFTADEVASAKRALLEERRTNRAQDRVIAGALAQQAYLGRTFAESARIDSAIEATDVAAVNAALRKYVAPAKLAWAFAGDFAKK